MFQILCRRYRAFFVIICCGLFWSKICSFAKFLVIDTLADLPCDHAELMCPQSMHSKSGLIDIIKEISLR